MIEVRRYHLSKADFAGMRAEERALFFLAGQTLNQVNVWLKIIRLSSSFESTSEVENRLSAAQTQIILRPLFGTLHEAWVWIQRKDVGPLVKAYVPKLPDEAQNARRALSTLLKSPLMRTLRNGYAYHSPSSAVLDKSFAAMPDDEDWSLYVSGEHSSTMMLPCETVLGYGIAQEGKGADPRAGFSNILSEAIAVANAMNEFLTGLLAVVLGSNLPTRPKESSFRIEHAPNLKETAIPFYIEGI